MSGGLNISDEDNAKLMLLGLKFEQRYFYTPDMMLPLRQEYYLVRDDGRALRWFPREYMDGVYATARIIKNPTNFVDAAIRYAGQEEFWY